MFIRPVPILALVHLSLVACAAGPAQPPALSREDARVLGAAIGSALERDVDRLGADAAEVRSGLEALLESLEEEADAAMLVAELEAIDALMLRADSSTAAPIRLLLERARAFINPTTPGGTL